MVENSPTEYTGAQLESVYMIDINQADEILQEHKLFYKLFNQFQ